MNEEMNNIYEENETAEDIVVYDEPETSGKSILGKIVAGAVIAAVGAGALVYKNRAKLEQRKIERLRKKGYVVYKPEVVEAKPEEENVSEDEAE